MTKVRKISQKVLRKDMETHSAIQGFATYSPTNPSITHVSLSDLSSKLLSLQSKSVQMETTYNATIDSLRSAERAFHDAIMTSKVAVLGQYGMDSNEAKAIGLKRTSEYKKPKRKAVKVQ
jgi:hypothetical protein